jgi:nucleolar protein 12
LDAKETQMERNGLPLRDVKVEKSRKSRQRLEGGKGGKRKRKESEPLDEDAGDRYPAVTEVDRDTEHSSYNSSDDDVSSNLVHESLKGKSKTHSGKRAKYTPSGETQQQHDARTVFVGNLPVEVAQKRVGFPLLQGFTVL